MKHLSWVAKHGMSHNFIELHKPYTCVVAHTPLTRLWSMKGNSKFTQVLIFIYLLWTQLMCYSFKMPLCEICYLFSCVIDYFAFHYLHRKVESVSCPVVSFSQCPPSTSRRACSVICYLIDSSLLGSSVHGIRQARIPEWVAIPLSRGSSRPRDQTYIS